MFVQQFVSIPQSSNKVLENYGDISQDDKTQYRRDNSYAY